ncbi:putative Dipeptidyl Peptidase IV [Monocercomonoides exilis]|uniref:putative Dipeptidyl Peptidase IV n=1 Tax=Monocercomonoides exilis TaxID=2049356 RepID=UPI003559DA0D|nr:putative Dipeptidyl Peptidase IV [Monocercomonoides exilis]|eukprot:MONOS_13748.1-p1 / transcript=MONOS_13748.1 / gene=MONOS_13748 / organism=Monocercomonoides_exilis_PA203 / gene_product=Dipeptidyl Peptidase IV / transcript_product=Dipeptidyl Peptidase IV / location=Mono_scaffold00876:18534-21737(-) / protein_length=888 / sequence_SO=supercontig / SO=protein_coding / is_pseudo=false
MKDHHKLSHHSQSCIGRLCSSDIFFVICAASVSVVYALIVILLTSYVKEPENKNAFSFDDIFSLHPKGVSAQWLKKNNKFIYVDTTKEEMPLYSVDATNNNSALICTGKDVAERHNKDDKPYSFDNVEISEDGKLILFAINVKPIYRHSSFGDYIIYDLDNKEVVEVRTDNDKTQLQMATFAPNCNKDECKVAYVKKNDVYAMVFKRNDKNKLEVEKDIRITDSTKANGEPFKGDSPVDADILNGIADWGHEEEIMEGDRYLWWDENGQYVAFATFNQKDVPIVSIPHYDDLDTSNYPDFNEKKKANKESSYNYPLKAPAMHTQIIHSSFSNKKIELPVTDAAPSDNKLDVQWKFRYPSPGQPISKVSVSVYDVKGETLLHKYEFNDNEAYLGKCLWADKTFVYTVYNRYQTERVFYGIEVGKEEVKEKRICKHTAVQGTWLTPSTSPIYVDSLKSIVDLWDSWKEPDDKTGCSIGIFPLDNTEDKAAEIVIKQEDFPYDVIEISGFDSKNQKLFFIAAAPSANDRALFWVSLNKVNGKYDVPKYLFDKVGTHTASFSDTGEYFVHSYQNYATPPVYTLCSSSEPEKYQMMEDNSELIDTLNSKAYPQVEMRTVTINNEEYRMRIMKPQNLDERKKYPTMLYVYGGPNHNMVNNAFDFDNWHVYMCSSKGLVIVSIDAPGSGAQGIKFRSRCFKTLGVENEVVYTELMKKLPGMYPFVDEQRLMIYGWSFGGYMTIRTLSRSEDTPFKFGIAVAPVTDWSLYDAPYTERFMQYDAKDRSSYVNSSNLTPARITAISKGKKWTLCYGTSDDNVHPVNSLQILRKLVDEEATNYALNIFPNDQHSIRLPHSRRSLYGFLTEQIDQKLGFYPRTERQRIRAKRNELSKDL